MAEDLSQDLLPSASLQDANIGLDEHRHRMSMERSLFSSAIAIVVLLFMTAIVMGFFLIHLIHAKPEMHWHASLIVAAFVVPPTVIVIGLLRAIFKARQADDEALGTGVLVHDFCKEALKKSLDWMKPGSPPS